MEETVFDKTKIFVRWYDSLDETVKDKIDRRIGRAENGNFGDVRHEGGGVYALRFIKLGIRLYYCQRGKTVYLLLTGGDKNTKKEQSHDIDLAKAIKLRVERGEEC